MIACLIFGIVGIFLVVALVLYTMKRPTKSDDEFDSDIDNHTDEFMLHDTYRYIPKAV